MELWSQLVPEDKKFTLVNSPKDFAKMTRILEDKERVAVDTETTGLNFCVNEICGVSIAYSFEEAFYVPYKRGKRQFYWENEAINKWLDDYLKSDGIMKSAHNGKYDRKMLRKDGFDIGGFVFDTMLADYLLNENNPHALEKCARRELGDDHANRHDKLHEIVANMGWKRNPEAMWNIPHELMTNYACMDTIACWKLAEIYHNRLEEQNLARLFYTLVMPLQEVIMEMEERGVRIDVELLQSLKDGEPEYTVYEKQIFEMVGFKTNLNSPEQVMDMLYNKLQLPEQKDKEGTRTSDDKALEKLQDKHPVVELMRKYRSAFKLYTSYVVGLWNALDGDRLHTSYLVHGTRTGRLSSAEPNLQNIPRGKKAKYIKDCFVADDGTILGFYDFSQIELRVLAFYSRDPILMDAYLTGKDIHRKTASAVFQMPFEQVDDERRQGGKTINFGIIYGMTEHGLVENLKGFWKEGNEYMQAREFINRYFAEYKEVRKLVDRVHQDMDSSHEVISMFGRRRRFPQIDFVEGNKKKYLQRQGFNALVQGTASDITSLALVKTNNMLKEKGFETRPVLDIHDELVFLIPENEIEAVDVEIKKVMQTAPSNFDIPLEVDGVHAKSWGDK